QRTIDWGYPYVGRRDRRAATVKPSPVSVNVTSMSPWRDGDGMELYVSNTDAALYCPQCNATAAPKAGDTRLVDMGFDWMAAGHPWLVSATHGDKPRLIHDVGRTTASGLSFQTAGQVAELVPVQAPGDQSDGQPFALTGDFVDVPQDQAIH